MNLYGKIFGRNWLTTFHEILLAISLHGLGFDNGYWPSGTGEKRFIHKMLKTSDIQVSLDIGANVGKYSRSLLENLETTVYAFEPLHSSYTELEKIQTDYPGRFFPVHSAVGNIDGTAIIYSKAERAETATLSKKVLSHSSIEEEVKISKLDSLVTTLNLPRVDFIKIDTEGFEKEVFEGMQGVLDTYKPKYIQFEFNVLHLYRKYTLLELTDLLPGYAFYRLLPNGWMEIDPKKFLSNVFMFCNIVAVRKD